MYYVVETVPDTKRKTVYITTAFFGEDNIKAKDGKVIYVKKPNINVQNALNKSSADENLPSTEEEVKSLANPDAEQMFSEETEDGVKPLAKPEESFEEFVVKPLASDETITGGTVNTKDAADLSDAELLKKGAKPVVKPSISTGDLKTDL